MVNIPTSLNDLKTKVGDSDVGKLKIVPIDLSDEMTNLIDVVYHKVVKNKKLNTLKTKVSK